MVDSAARRKIVYLFGAGATHAELAVVEPHLTSDDKLQRELGLLTSHVSARVIARARSAPGFLKGLEFLEPPTKPESIEPARGIAGAMNIELLISLIENSKIQGWERKTEILKELVRADIQGRLSLPKRRRFFLHKSLFELHKFSEDEELIGVISLNYDNVLDQAYREFYGTPNYCLCLDQQSRLAPEIPLLKLHGSFDWSNGVRVRGRRRSFDIIPLGSNKNYLHAPYNFIWTRALELLIECDALRVIGCSLSQNDTHLVDLLFKAHLEKVPERMKGFEIEIISTEAAGKSIRENYGFFPGIKALKSSSSNPFRGWLMGRASRLSEAALKSTQYLRRLRIRGLRKE